MDRVTVQMENIDELKHTISDRERTIAEQQRIIDELNIAIEKQNAEIKRKNAENRRLQAQYAMKCDDFNTIESAFFWKMTKPLRVILDKLKWALRNNKVAHKIWDTLKSIKGGDKKEKVELQPSEFFGKGDSIVILCTRHTLFVANLIKNSLSKASVDANIIMKEPDKYETDSAYIVICPQMFKKLPEKFIAFQMEQTVSSRWLTNSYYDKLAKAYAIFDYSLNNIKYFKDNTELGKLFYYMPIDFHPNYEAECCGYEYDVLFYGDINNLRRKEMIEELRKHFSVKVVSEVFGEELYDELSRAKIVVNIHYYENAMLETTRIYEVLSLGRSIVISERSSDPEEEKRLDGIVDFVDIGKVFRYG